MVLQIHKISILKEIFKDKIFEARQKSTKSSKIFTLKNFRLYGIMAGHWLKTYTKFENG